MNVASLELSKKLHELSGWETGTTGFNHDSDGLIAFGWFEGAVPAYDCGYLLRKLPNTTHITIYDSHSGAWITELSDIETVKANTPEDALAKLAIKLFKTGVLEREDTQQ